MTEHILFVTGKLAEKSLKRVLASIEHREFNYEIRVLGVSVAALLTAAMIRRRVGTVECFDRVILPDYTFVDRISDRREKIIPGPHRCRFHVPCVLG